MTARFLAAEEARSLGLVDDVVEDDALAAAAETAARAFAAGPGGAYAAIKALTRAARGNDLPAQLALEEAHVVRLARDPAVAAAMAAMLKPRSYAANRPHTCPVPAASCNVAGEGRGAAMEEREKGGR